jgi:hypothetical protein
MGMEIAEQDQHLSCSVDAECLQHLQRQGPDIDILTCDSLSQALQPHDVKALEEPWLDLAAWHWDLWDEINHDLARGLSDDRLPSKSLRDELVCLYFQHVHPVCPIFDEVEFHSTYYLNNDDMSFLQCISLLEFQAMMFVASLVREVLRLVRSS